jgi:hypothetical protein
MSAHNMSGNETSCLELRLSPTARRLNEEVGTSTRAFRICQILVKKTAMMRCICIGLQYGAPSHLHLYRNSLRPIIQSPILHQSTTIYPRVLDVAKENVIIINSFNDALCRKLNT